MPVLRTPDERFLGLPGYGFAPRYVTVPDDRYGPLRMHYLDEGPADAPVILLLHGQGCWSYLYRHMIPLLTASGFRCIAPDYIGFGRSEKLPSTEDYTFQRHIDWLTAFLDALELRDVTAYLSTGADSSAAHRRRAPEFFGDRRQQYQAADGAGGRRHWFVRWREEQCCAAALSPGRDGERRRGPEAPPGMIAAFDAPYPDDSYKTGPRRFPMILPIVADDPAAVADARPGRYSPAGGSRC